MPPSRPRTETFTPVLVIHGGAGRTISESRKKIIKRKLARILNASYEILLAGNALDAAVHAVKLMEDDPAFNAGTGSLLQADGRARLSSSVMDGAELNFAGVINVENVPNPVLLACTLLKNPERVLSGKGAERFAKRAGFFFRDPRTPSSIRRWNKRRLLSCDTVGACALDGAGRLASATSTGGRGMEAPGRVSDSAMPAGNYASNHCAVSATGHGEEIISEALASKIAQRVGDGMSIAKAFRVTFSEVRGRKRRMGAIGVDKNGNTAVAATTESLAYAWKKGGKIKLF